MLVASAPLPLMTTWPVIDGNPLGPSVLLSIAVSA